MEKKSVQTNPNVNSAITITNNSIAAIANSNRDIDDTDFGTLPVQNGCAK